jgi:uncharacterized membrane protein HdeD (DUF308 family)
MDRLSWVGILLVVLGALAVLAPALAGGAVVTAVGLFLLVAGIVQVGRAFRAAGREKVLTVALGVIAMLAGIVVALHPLLGRAFLTLMLTAYFAAEGIWKVVAALRTRPRRGWAWLLASGLVSLALAWLIWRQWPLSGLWAVGVLVGVNLIVSGIALMRLEPPGAGRRA